MKREDVPVREESKMKPAVAVVEPPRRRSLVEVVRVMVLFVGESVQMVEAAATAQFVPSARHTLLPPIVRDVPDPDVKARVVAVA